MCFSPKCTQSTFILSHAAVYLVVQYLVEKSITAPDGICTVGSLWQSSACLGLHGTTEVLEISLSLQLAREQRWESSQLWIFLPFPLILK